MTIEQRLDQLEQQNHRIERKNKRLTAALTLMVPHLKRRDDSYANW